MSNETIYTLLSAVAAQGAGDAVRVDAPGALVLVTSASTSSATVLIQGSLDNSVWQTLKSISNPAAGPSGSAYMGTAWKYMRANVSAWSSGTITAKMQLLDVDPGAWKTAESPTATATDISVGTVTCTKVINDDLTTGRVVISTTAGELTDNSGLLFDGSYLTVPSLKDTAATATRVPYAGASKELAYNAAFTFTASGAILASTVFSGGLKHTIAAKAGDGAITSAPGVIVITKASPLGSSTLATPTVTAHDGYILTIVAGTAAAHVVSCASGKVNGGSITTLTFGGAIGDSVTMVAYQGVWYVISNINVTIS